MHPPLLFIAMVDELRRQLKESREELKKRGKIIEKLTEKITELRKIKHTYQKREKRQSLSKDKSSVRCVLIDDNPSLT